MSDVLVVFKVSVVLYRNGTTDLLTKFFRSSEKAKKYVEGEANNGSPICWVPGPKDSTQSTQAFDAKEGAFHALISPIAVE